MVSSHPIQRFIVAGQLRRVYTLLPAGKARVNALGGSLVYSAAGLGVWDEGIGLIGRVSSDFPVEWLEQMNQHGFDTRGIRILSETIDHRYFAAYPDINTCQSENPVGHFTRVGLPFPAELLDFVPDHGQLDSRTRLTHLTLRLGDIPQDFMDATAAHLCPLDYLSHSLLPPSLRQGHISTITINPSAGYMNPTFWNDMPALLNGITALLTTEEKLRSLFQGRTSDLWEMAAGVTAWGCEMVAVDRGSRGHLIYDSSSRGKWVVPVYPTQMIDPTGTEDAFCGGFLVGYRRTYDPLQAALYGTISKSMVSEGIGPFFALGSLPGLADARLFALKDMAYRE